MRIEHGRLFQSIIEFNEFKTIVEIGVAKGITSKFLCKAAENTGGNYYGFDVWDKHGANLNKKAKRQFKSPCSKDSVENKLKDFKNICELVQINTLKDNFSKLLKEKCPVIDFAFIDGDHSYWGIKNDFNAVYPLLNKYSIVAFHDTQKIDGCREFILDLRTIYTDGTYDIIDFPYGNYSRRVGVSLLVKRAYPILNIDIDEICGSISTKDDIQQREKNWYKYEKLKNLHKSNE